MQRHTMTEIVNHSRSSDLERSVKNLLGWAGGLNRFYVATTLALFTDSKNYVVEAELRHAIFSHRDICHVYSFINDNRRG